MGIPSSSQSYASRIKMILNIAIPTSIGLSSSYIMMFVDMMMVGQLGNNALGAIGLAGVANMLILSVFVGMPSAIQGIVARRVGEKSIEPLCKPLNSGLIVVCVIALPISITSYLLSASYFELVTAGKDIISQGVPYLRALVVGFLAYGIMSVFEGFWNGIARSRVFMAVSLIINSLNVFLNYIFIYGNFGMTEFGTLGAGIASSCSIYIGVCIYGVFTIVNYRDDGFLSERPSVALINRVLHLGLPPSIQQAFFAVGSMVLFWIYGSMGDKELAASTILVRVTMVLLLFSVALGHSSSTLVSNALGRGDHVDAFHWGSDCAALGVLIITVLGLPILFFPGAFLMVFVSDVEIIEITTIPLQLTALTTGVLGLSYIFAMTLYSVGDGKRVVIVSLVLRWVLFIPLAWLVGFYLKYGLLEVWFIQSVYGLLLAGVLTYFWVEGQWNKIEIKLKLN